MSIQNCAELAIAVREGSGSYDRCDYDVVKRAVDAISSKIVLMNAFHAEQELTGRPVASAKKSIVASGAPKAYARMRAAASEFSVFPDARNITGEPYARIILEDRNSGGSEARVEVLLAINEDLIFALREQCSAYISSLDESHFLFLRPDQPESAGSPLSTLLSKSSLTDLVGVYANILPASPVFKEIWSRSLVVDRSLDGYVVPTDLDEHDDSMTPSR